MLDESSPPCHCVRIRKKEDAGNEVDTLETPVSRGTSTVARNMWQRCALGNKDGSRTARPTWQRFGRKD